MKISIKLQTELQHRDRESWHAPLKAVAGRTRGGWQRDWHGHYGGCVVPVIESIDVRIGLFACVSVLYSSHQWGKKSSWGVEGDGIDLQE